MVAQACEGINGVSASEVELRSHVQFYDKIKTSDVQETLIKAAADLISEDTPNYQYVAGRLINYHLRKEAYGSFNPPPLETHVRNLIAKGLYDPALIDMFDRRHVGILSRHCTRHRDQRFTRRIGDEVEVKIVAGRGHRDPCVSCESLWSLPERIEDEPRCPG